MSEEIENLERELRKLAEIHFPERNFEGFSEAKHGASHYTCFVELSNGEELVFKLSCAEGSGLSRYESRFSIDAPVIETVHRSTSVPVPEIYYYDSSKERFDYEYIILEKLVGENLYSGWGSEGIETVREAGCLLANLHKNIKFEESGKIQYDGSKEQLYIEEAEKWPQMFGEMMRKLSSNLDDTEFSDYQKEILGVVNQNLDLLKGDFNPALVHQEFGPRNILVNSGKITGVIDWERSISAPPEYDLFLTEKHITSKGDGSAEISENSDNISKALLEGYREVRDLKDGWRKRRPLYHLAYVTQMMWVLDDDEQNLKALENQFSEIEEGMQKT